MDVQAPYEIAIVTILSIIMLLSWMSMTIILWSKYPSWIRIISVLGIIFYFFLTVIYVLYYCCWKK